MKKENDSPNSIHRFSNRVENYIKYRPHYPKEIISFLNNEIGLDPSSLVADIGSGPGISAENFIENGNTVFAIEPNDNMRNAAERIIGKSKNFISVNGTAESTTLQGNSIDLIISGQAFHWFDKEKCKTEFKRILKPGGYVVLMWNLRVPVGAFMKNYDKFLIRYGKDYEKLYKDDVDAREIADFFSPVINRIKKFTNYQMLDYRELEGRLLSSSYIQTKENPVYEDMINDLKNIFDKNVVDGKIKMEYETTLFYGKLLAKA